MYEVRIKRPIAEDPYNPLLVSVQGILKTIRMNKGAHHIHEICLRCLYLFTMIAGMTVVLCAPAHAQCAAPTGNPGDILFNQDHDVFQGCTTKGWMAFHSTTSSGGPSGPAGCPNIGDVCTNDGTIYAGEFNGNKLYINSSDATTTQNWGDWGSVSGTGFCDTSPYTGGSCDTGDSNTQTMDLHSNTFPAAEYCADLTSPSSNAHGHSDWYLPSRNELDAIYDNLKAGNPAGTHGFQNADYWSSSENSNSHAWLQNFTTGAQNTNAKNAGLRVRCVRR